MKPTLNNDTESYPVALYDMSIKDVKERFAKRITFPKAVMAANFLGYVPRTVYDIINSKSKKKYGYHRETKKKYAIRKIREDEIVGDKTNQEL